MKRKAAASVYLSPTHCCDGVTLQNNNTMMVTTS